MRNLGKRACEHQVGVALAKECQQVEPFEGKYGFVHVEDKSSFPTFATVTPITLISDYGHDSVYVGLLKGSICKRMPGAEVIDITHSVAKFDTAHAAFLLRAAVPSFPKGTVHIVAVNAEAADRPHRIVKVLDHFFIRADSGIFI